MTVEFVTAGTPISGGELSKPAGTEDGMVMVALWVSRGTTTFTSMTGPNWTKIAEVDSVGIDTSTTVAAFWSMARADDPGTWGASFGGGNLWRAIMLVYDGVDQDDAIDAVSMNSGIGPEVTWASVTAAKATRIIGVNAHVTAGTTIDDPAGVTRRWAPASASGGEAQGYAWDKAVSAGPSGTFLTTFPGGEADGWGALTIALRPAPSRFHVGHGRLGFTG